MTAEQMTNPQSWEALQERKAAIHAEREAVKLTAKRQALEQNPFDPRTEVSADAKRITRTLWIIFVLLPVVFAILYSIAKGN